MSPVGHTRSSCGTREESRAAATCLQSPNTLLCLVLDLVYWSCARKHSLWVYHNESDGGGDWAEGLIHYEEASAERENDEARIRGATQDD